MKLFENAEMYKANPFKTVNIHHGMHYKCDACKCYCKAEYITGYSDSKKACAWCIDRIAKRKGWTYDKAKAWVLDVSTKEHYKKKREREERMQTPENEE